MTDGTDGITWDAICSFYEKLGRAPLVNRNAVRIIGRTKWGRMLDGCADEQEREALRALTVPYTAAWSVIVSDLIDDDHVHEYVYGRKNSFFLP
jgi:hypothetical protein